MSVVFLAAEVERFALLRAFAAPRRLAGALAVLGHRLAGLAGHAGAQRIGIDRGVAVAILDAATGAGGDDDGKQDWKAHAGDPFVRRGPRLCRSCAKAARPGTKRCCRRSEEHTSELQSLMSKSYAVLCMKKKTQNRQQMHRIR